MTELAKIERDEAHHLPSDPMVSMIERVVMNPNADLDKLERMLAMKERMDAQNAKVSFARALSAARTTIPPIIKDAQVDFTTAKGRTQYKHETLAGIAKVIDPILAEHGLSYRFRTDQGQGGVRVTCIIQHSDGHSEETSLSGAPDGSGSKNSFQAVGSAVTYLQRYTLKAALGLSAEVDDDGQGAAPRQEERQQPREDKQAAFEREVQSTVRQIEREGNLASLGDFWADLNKRAKGVASDPRCIEAKDRRKAELTAPKHDDNLVDEIPY